MSEVKPGTVYWIDHYVICTNDIDRWAAFHAKVLGARLRPDPAGALTGYGIFQDVASIRHGGFIAQAPLPPTRGLGKGMPRYGYYIFAGDIEAHLKRLDEAGAIHSGPVRMSAEGEPGTVIYWQDPDGNQFEFWAPDVLPDGAMHGHGAERVGRISHGVFESRDLERTAAFFARYCALEPERNATIEAGTLVFRLAAGARLVFRQVNELEGRTTGCGLRDAHTALTVRKEDFFPNYARVFAHLPEWEFDAVSGKLNEDREALRKLPARTAQHPSQGGLKFKATTDRGDDFFDWDTNMFHFFGCTPIGGSYAVYEGHAVEELIADWERTHGNLESLRAFVKAAETAGATADI
jgi:predicted enzyme related to lactoylglutathione lyase